MAKKETITTPAGKAFRPYIVVPSDKFKKEGEYSIKLILTKEAAVPLLTKLQPLYDDAVAEAQATFKAEPVAKGSKRGELKIWPLYNVVYDEDENETDEIIFNFGTPASGVTKSGKAWERKVAIFDANGKPIKTKGLQVWSDSVVRINFTPSAWYVKANGCGLSLRLNAVQIIDLVSGGNRSADSYGFDVVEGGYSHDVFDEDHTPLDAADATDAADDSDEGDF